MTVVAWHPDPAVRARTIEHRRMAAFERDQGTGDILTFRFRGISEVLAAGGPIDWLIDNVLPQRSLSILYGEPESAKSFIAIDWACSVATGCNWMDKPTSSGVAAIVAGEGQAGIGRRLRAWSMERTDVAGMPLIVSDDLAQLRDPRNAEAVSDALYDQADKLDLPVRLLVVDTLSRCLGIGADENSAADVSAFVHNLDRLFIRRFGCAVVVVHHTGHSQPTRARGSSALRAAADAEFLVTRDGSRVTLIPRKTKDWEPMPASTFELERIELPIDGNHEVVASSCILRPIADTTTAASPIDKLSGQQRRALDALHDLKGEGVDVRLKDWRACLKDRAIIVDRRRWHELLDRLELAGAIRIEGGHVWPK